MNQELAAARSITSAEERSQRNWGFLDILGILAQHWRLLSATPVLTGATALAITTYVVPPTFTASTTFLPPQQSQSSAATAIASLGALSGLAGAAAGIKTAGDQYVALMQSVRVSDRIVEQLGLMKVYDTTYRAEARRKLAQNVQINYGKRDGLITVDADARSPELAAKIANLYVEELRKLTSELAITEAQQRRSFFEAQLNKTRTALSQAQMALQASGFNASALKAEPRAAAEGFATLRAQTTAAEVRLQTMRRSMMDSSAEVQQQITLLGALHAQLARMSSSTDDAGGTDYISRFREFKYQESLFELFSKQYELAKLDESREGAAIQVVDVATPPELKSKPKRALISVAAAIMSFVFLAMLVVLVRLWRDDRDRPQQANA